jgi:hypothetical protein
MPLCFWATQTAVTASDLFVEAGRSKFAPYLPLHSAVTFIQHAYHSYVSVKYQMRALLACMNTGEARMNASMACFNAESVKFDAHMACFNANQAKFDARMAHFNADLRKHVG